MSTAKKVLRILGGIVVALVLLIAAVGYVWGPTLTAQMTGQARFFGTDTPKRYANTVLDLSESMGIYGDSEEFAAARAEVEEAAKSARHKYELIEPLDAAVHAAGGKHSKLHPGQPQDSAGDTPPVQADVETTDGVALATVPGIGRHDDVQGYADTLTRGLIEARDGGACGAIVDLRGNDGGDMGPMVAGLSPLLPDGTALEFVSHMNTTAVTVEGNAVRGGGTPLETTGGKWEAPTAVLVDANTASSGEATMLAFRGLDTARSFGSPTAGFASANMVYDFPDGSVLMLTIAKDKARTGEEFAEYPIQPDSPTATGDEALDEAKAWLREQHGCGGVEEVQKVYNITSSKPQGNSQHAAIL
ncbi:S41 family peptidase [Corynebacterium gottingense]|uniref:S41 family peptidase n=1 Tax=Corynebacterium gottingense TaxID=2041036 RepID=UPI0038CF78D3